MEIGSNGRIKGLKKHAVIEQETISCACGCGELIEKFWLNKEGRWHIRQYVHNHHRVGKNSENQKRSVRVKSDAWWIAYKEGMKQRNKSEGWIKSVSSVSAKKRWSTSRKHELREEIEVHCSFCQKHTKVKPSRIQHKLYFCNRKCSGSYYSGERNNKYTGRTQGGIYPAVWTKELKDKIRKRDGNKCVICSRKPGRWEKKLHVHHIDENKENCDENNLVSLCNSCHRSVHFKTKELPKRYIDMRYDTFSLTML